MSLTGVEPLERARRYLADADTDVVRIDPLVGEASNRAYCRVVLQNGERRILALLPEPFEPEASPFLDTASLFSAVPVRIPGVLDVAGERGILLLEDLGDELLQDAVERGSSARKQELYEEAIDILVRLQRRGQQLADDRFFAFRTAFDSEKFIWELEFFRAHFLEGFYNSSIETGEREKLTDAFGALAAALCEQEFVLCHRDYHARNLMVVPDGLAVIDFQDARQGPRSYDVVSLLNDCYVEHSEDFVATMVERFERGVGVSIGKDYDVTALQRNLKALGTFGYQIGRRDNAVYQRYLGGTLRLVQANLERNPRWDSLRRILARYCEEIR